MSQIIDQLNWRYAVKEFDSSKKLNKEQLETILECLRLSPSSFGLQPWKFIVVENEEIRKQLIPASYGQPQVADASHLIVFARPTSFGEAQIDEFLQSTCDAREVSLESITEYGDMMKGFMSRMDEDAIAAWAKNQIYIALGNLLTCCAIEKIDACPMEGFDPSVYDEVLELNSKGLSSSVLCPIGFRKEGDKYANLAKVRYETSRIIETIE